MANDFFTNIPDYSGIGIYALINNRTGKMYIGASQNVHQRILQHKHSPLNAIKDDINSGDTFRVEILEKLPLSSNQFEMFGREKHFIDLYDVIKHGYNQASTTCCPKEDLLKSLEYYAPNSKMAIYISNIIAKRESPIYTRNINGNYVKNNYDRINVTFPKGQKEVITAAAEAAGESVNGYIKKAVEQRMQRDAE